jgi:copper chaperone NosL
MNKLKTGVRLALVISGLALIAVNFLPMWRIDLDAPQYPEGLSLLIHTNGLGGSVDIINGLNHYIGMRTLHSEDFPEFKILPWIIYLFSFLFILTAYLNRFAWLRILFLFFLVFGVVAFVDFWRWEYNYGHNLDPNAAIRVPGMAYQPPLIGYKQLLNFAAYSIPDAGGWIFIGSGMVLLISIFIEKKFSTLSNRANKSVLGVLFVSGIFFACSPKPEPFSMGKDECAYCRMKLTEPSFAAQIVTETSKVYKFDDIVCAAGFLHENRISSHEVFGVYFADYSNPELILHSDSCLLFECAEFHSPMNGNIAAFRHEADIQSLPFHDSGKIRDWKNYLQQFSSR